MDDLDYETWSVHRETIRTARKRYRCACCGCPIIPGDKYLDHFSVFDHDAYSERCCMACEKVRSDFDHIHNFRTTPSSFQQLLQDEDPSMCPDGWGQALADMEERWRP